jgi:hypothetical protein
VDKKRTVLSKSGQQPHHHRDKGSGSYHWLSDNRIRMRVTINGKPYTGNAKVEGRRSAAKAKDALKDWVAEVVGRVGLSRAP